MRENIELCSNKLDVSRYDWVATDANHEIMSVFIVLEEVMRLVEEDFRFVVLALLAFYLRCLGEDVVFLLRAPPPRNV